MNCPKCLTENTLDAKYCQECGTLLHPSQELAVTQTLAFPSRPLTRGVLFAGRYEIIEGLGIGGMGEVFRVEDKKTSEELALKLLRSDISSDETTIERFANELKLAHKISHKYICRIYHLEEFEGTRYITMEYVPGQELKNLIKQTGKLTTDTVIAVTKQICEGLAEAHKLGVIHRDLKPGNIMIDNQGNVRIMDFGIARSSRSKGITGIGMMIGTPEYMSPEQAEGCDVDQRSDIYSMGVILYEMVAGRPPFEGDSPLSIALKHKSDIPKNPVILNPQVPESLGRVILKCLEKNREKRYASAEELLLELNQIGGPAPYAQKILEWDNSIAVLPFKNMSMDPEQEYFCEGLAEELINALTQIRDLRVVARTSAFSFKGQDVDVREIGRKLNVATVLEGSVRKSGNRLRITAQLIGVADGYHLWSERYDREMADVFAIQDEITLTITDRLKLKLLGKEKERIIKRYTEDVESYKIYLKGLYFRRKLTEENIRKAIEFFQLAIDRDPDNALAYAGLAYSHMVLAWYSPVPPREAYPKAKQAALKAIELDDQLAEAHEALTTVLAYFEWDWENGISHAQRAVELNPGYAWAYFHLANIYLYQAKFEESLGIFTKAHALDPLNMAFNRNLGAGFLWAGQPDKAVESLKRAIEMDPSFPASHLYLGLAYMGKSMYKEAIEAIQEEKAYPQGVLDAYKGIIYSRMGKKQAAKEILNHYLALPEEQIKNSFCLALLCFSLGETDIGFQWLERAFRERDVWMTYIKIESNLDPVRTDPRYKALLERMRL